jgi:A/G-specific adenine glycosylase
MPRKIVQPSVASPMRPRRFAARLIAWHGAHGRHDLPWQGTRNPYRIWLSEIMLQQTQVATVIPYYRRFLDAFPHVRALAAAPEDRVLEHWSGLGYYRRAHHLHAAAKTIVERHGGEFPPDVDAIAALPGVGRSTAAAIAAFAFGARAAILDGNVKRVLARHRGIDGFPGAPKVEAALWQVAESLLPRNGLETYTQALMDLGATVCTRNAPMCEACPVARDCVALAQDRIGALPSARPRKALPQRAVKVLLIERAGAILFEKRPATGIWGGLWSLPETGIESKIGVECKRRFGATVEAGDTLPPIEHGFTHYRLTIHPQRVAVRAWPRRAEAPGLVWLTREDALSAALPAPIRKLLRAL